MCKQSWLSIYTISGCIHSMQPPWKILEPWLDTQHRQRCTIRELSRGLSTFSTQLGSYYTLEISLLSKWTSTIDQVALWFLLHSLNCGAEASSWSLLGLSSFGRIIWIDSIPCQPREASTLCLPGNTSSEGCSYYSLSLDRSEFNGQVNLGNAAVSTDN